MDFLQMVIGEGECTYQKIVDILLMDSVSSKTSQEWRRFAKELNVKPYYIKKLDQDMRLDKHFFEDIFRDVLTEWKLSKGKTATVGELVGILKKIQWNAVSDELFNAFQNTSTEPESDSQNLSDTIPHKLSYYVPRKLLAKNQMSITTLASTIDSEIYFVFIGISYEKLNDLVSQKLARSGEMKNKWSVDTRYILLDQDEDWHKLCEKSERCLHLIEFEEGRFICLRSHGEINNFRNILITEGDNNEFSEETFLNVVNKRENEKLKSNIPICIADSPGMGKSVLMAKFGRQLKEKCPERDVAYIVFQEYIYGIKNSPEIEFEDKVKSTLIDKLSVNQNLREKLKLDFDSNNKSILTKYEFFFDGFDEIQADDFELGYKCLNELVRCLHHCARFWVTTRLHLLEELENCLGVYGYRIQPFNEEDKLKFLINCWSPIATEVVHNRTLKDFGERCLSAIESKLSDRDRDILGIPLVCKLMAVVYEAKARDFCGSNDTDDFEIKSITALFESFIENRILKGLGIKTSSKEILDIYCDAINRQQNLHVFLSMELIFPTKVSDLLSQEQINQLKFEKIGDKLLKVGIVEAISMKAEPRFLHRTLAEYFVAKFLVDSLHRERAEKISRFFFQIASTDDYPNIRYFIDCLLKQNPKIYTMNINLSFSSLETKCSLNKALESLIQSDHVNIFKLFHVVFDKELLFKTGEPTWIYLAVKHSSVEMINFIYEYYDDLQTISKLKLHPCQSKFALLLELIRTGKVEKLTYLLNDHGYNDYLFHSNFDKLRECLRVCLFRTASIKNETHLQQRLQIFETLISIYPDNFRNNEAHSFCIKVQFSVISTKLLTELLRHGIDFAEVDEFCDTLYLEVLSRHDTLSLRCFLRTFAEGIWKTTVRLRIREQNILLGYMENDIPLEDMKEIPLFCLLLSALEGRMDKLLPHKRCKALNIVTVYNRIMQKVSRSTNSDNKQSNLVNLQILLAFRLLDLNLPIEFKSELTINLKDDEMYKLYKSVVSELKQSPNSSIKVTNIDVAAQCLVAEYTINNLSRTNFEPAFTFLFKVLLYVNITKRRFGEGEYFKEYVFFRHDLCRVLDKLLSRHKIKPTIPSSFNIKIYFFYILAASLCQNFKNIFSFCLDILRLTNVHPTTEASSDLNMTGSNTPSVNIRPFDCFKLIDRLQRYKEFHEVHVPSYEGFHLLTAMQEENIDDAMLKNIFAVGVDINSRDETGCTILGYAVKEQRYDVADILVGLGASFSAEYHAGQNILHHVVGAEKYEVFKKIIHPLSPNINEVDVNGNTVLHIALMQSKATDNLRDIVYELCSRGAQLDVVNKNGKTPLSLAAKRKDKIGVLSLSGIKDGNKT